MTSPAHLLLVDDHDFLRRGLRAFLEKDGRCRVVAEARSAEEAYTQLEATKVDLVVMDIHLPGDDGVVATTKIKQSWPRTKVLILSGKPSSATSATAEQALLAGADGFVSKEDGENLLPSAVASVLEGWCFLSPRPATEIVRGLRAAAYDPPSSATELTERESQVLKRLAEGASYKDIAAELEIGVKSVDTYRTRLTKKLGIGTREELVREAARLGLLADSG